MNRDGVYITKRDGMAVVKLDSGYNIGVPPNTCRFISRPEPVTIKQHDVIQNTSLPHLAIVSTGGTIASRIDYRTGSVHEPVQCKRYPDSHPGTQGNRQLPDRAPCHNPLGEQ